MNPEYKSNPRIELIKHCLNQERSVDTKDFLGCFVKLHKKDWPLLVAYTKSLESDLESKVGAVILESGFKTRKVNPHIKLTKPLCYEKILSKGYDMKVKRFFRKRIEYAEKTAIKKLPKELPENGRRNLFVWGRERIPEQLKNSVKKKVCAATYARSLDSKILVNNYDFETGREQSILYPF
ncbi:MAG: hypothetical protein GOU97_03490 [Nanoarchaeota archaeon]|nr:hypothetical protein [Nanoarchaeota archaeon]